MKFGRLLDYFFRVTALRMTGADQASVPIRWGEAQKVGPCWTSATNIGLKYPSGDQWTPIVGFGIDRSRAVAPIKSLMEALECLAYHDARHGAQSRSGMAAHFDLQKAKLKAYMELVERDGFLFHWLSETPGIPIDWREYRKLTGDLSLIPESESGPLRCVQLSSADPEIKICMAVSRVPSIGCWHVGLGAEKELGSAVARASREWLGLVHSHRVTGGKCPPAVFEAGQENIFAVHHTRSVDPTISGLLDHITAGKEVPFELPLEGDRSSVGKQLWDATHFQRLKTRSLRHCVVMAENSELLPLYFVERFHAERSSYLKNERLRKALPERFRFHSADRFLGHPLT